MTRLRSASPVDVPAEAPARSPRWPIGAIGAGVAGLFIVFLVEPGQIDSMIYFGAAQDLVAAEVNHWTTRLGLVLPTSVATSIFGHSEFGFYTVPIIYGAVFGASTAWLGWLAAGRLGLLAGVAAAASPFILPLGSQLLPDVAAAGLLALAVGLTVTAARSDPDRTLRTAVAAGAALGGAYLVREIAVVFLPALLAVGWVVGIRDRRRFLAIAGGAAGVALAESVVGWLIWGLPLARFQAVLGLVRDREARGGPTATPYLGDLGESLLVLPEFLWSSRSGQVVVALLGLAAIVAIWRRSLILGVVVGWVVGTWVLYSVLGSMGALRLLDRYWGVVVPFLVVAAIGGVVLLLRDLPRPVPWVAAGLAAIALVVLGVFDSLDRRYDVFMRFEDDGYWQLREAMEEMPAGAELYLPDRVAEVARIYTVDPLGRPLSEIELMPAGPGHVSPGGWLLVHEDAVRAVPGAGETTVAPPADLGVFAADDAGPSWVLLEPGPGWATMPVVTVGVDEWHVRYVDDGDWGPVEPLSPEPYPVDAGDRLAVVDGPEWLTAAGRTSATVQGGDLVEVRIALTSTGGRPIQAICSFYPVGGGDRTAAAAMTMVGIGPFDGELVAYCLPPAESGPATVRPYLVFTGSTTVDLGDGMIDRHRP